LKNFCSSITHQVVGFHDQKHHEQISLSFDPSEIRAGSPCLQGLLLENAG
jgi:hypothetical protein